MITGLYAAVAGLFLVYLSIRVIGLRRAKKISVGPAGDPDMERAMRVQANFIEYTPIALLLLFILEQNGLPPVFVHGLGAALIISRFVHFLGFRSADAPGQFRVIGMAATFTVIALLAIIALLQFVIGA